MSVLSEVDRLNTGVHNGVALAVGQPDPFWFLSGGTPAYSGPTYVTGLGAWQANSATSAWLGLLGNPNLWPYGDFTFSVSLDLTGVDVSQLRVTLRLAVDNFFTGLRVNGQPQAVPTITVLYHLGNPYVLNGLSGGVNIVEIDIQSIPNMPNPFALRIEASG